MANRLSQISLCDICVPTAVPILQTSLRSTATAISWVANDRQGFNNRYAAIVGLF